MDQEPFSIFLSWQEKHSGPMRRLVCYANIIAMATILPKQNEDPRQLLSDSQELMVRTRQLQRATWFPLLVLSAATFHLVLARRSRDRHCTMGHRLIRDRTITFSACSDRAQSTLTPSGYGLFRLRAPGECWFRSRATSN